MVGIVYYYPVGRTEKLMSQQHIIYYYLCSDGIFEKKDILNYNLFSFNVFKQAAIIPNIFLSFGAGI